ncbi:ATP-binding cassette subfamily B protein [Providencia alcalifaciens]|nr:ATP-binding cassette subfamily B protein [Providencia alcalifaciens]
MMKLLLNTVRGALSWMLLAAILEGISGLLLVPVIINWGSEELTPLFWLIVCSLVSLTVTFIATQKGYLAGGIVMRYLTNALIRHLPISLRPISSASSLVSGPVAHMMAIPAHLLSPIIRGVITPLTVIIGILLYDFWLGGLLLIIGLALLAILRFSANQVSLAEKQVHLSQQQIVDSLGHFASHQPLIRRAGVSHQEQQNLKQSLTQQYQTQKQLQYRSLPFHLLFSLCIQITFIGLLAAGLFSVHHNGLTLNMWLASMLLLAHFIEPLWLLSHLDQALRQAKKSLNQITEALSTPELAFMHSSQSPSHNIVSCVELSHFTNDGKQLLKSLNLNIDKKKLTAIVGESGAGKSTLLNLLARLQDPNQGAVYYGDKNIAQLSQEVLCRKRGVLFQDSHFFRGSLRQNLMAGSDNIDDREIIKQLSALNINADDALLDADVGPGGQIFSGGQLQRLCIARLLLSHPDIILMDEPTANLDHINTAAVIEVLRNATEQTRIVITHQPMLARQADHIIVMVRGDVIDQGSHDELMIRTPWYQQFINGNF